ASPRAAAAGRGPWAYRMAAFIHPSNLIALAAVLMIGLINPSGQVVLLGIGAEILFLCAAPRSTRLRRCLDQSYVEAAEAERVRAREAMIARMTDGHRDELRRLDGLVKKIGEAEPSSGGVDLTGLTSSY